MERSLHGGEAGIHNAEAEECKPAAASVVFQVCHFHTIYSDHITSIAYDVCAQGGIQQSDRARSMGKIQRTAKIQEYGVHWFGSPLAIKKCSAWTPTATTGQQGFGGWAQKWKWSNAQAVGWNPAKTRGTSLVVTYVSSALINLTSFLCLDHPFNAANYWVRPTAPWITEPLWWFGGSAAGYLQPPQFKGFHVVDDENGIIIDRIRISGRGNDWNSRHSGIWICLLCIQYTLRST